MAGQQGILHECDWPAGRITSFLFGSSLAASLHGEVSDVLAGGSEAMRVAAASDAHSKQLRAVPCADATRRRVAARRALQPLWQQYFASQYPQRTSATSRRVCPTDFDRATLPTRVLDMAVRSAGNDIQFLPEQPEQPEKNRGNSAENGRI